MLREDLIHKGLLFFNSLRRAAAWESVIIQTAIHRFRVELKDCSQTRSASSIYLVQGFAQNELADLLEKFFPPTSLLLPFLKLRSLEEPFHSLTVYTGTIVGPQHGLNLLNTFPPTSPSPEETWRTRRYQAKTRPPSRFAKPLATDWTHWRARP